MIIDLCSGHGGATQSFLSEDIIKIDIDPKVRPHIVADIKHLPLRPNLKPALVWASPPCTYFSMARWWKMGLNEKGIAESLKLVASIFEAIYYLKPEKWIVENPKGILRKLMPIKPTTTITYDANDEMHTKPTDLWSNNKSLKRAFIPKHISENLKTWLENEG